MCKPASFIVSRRNVWWHPTSDSHEDIIVKYRIKVEGVRGVNAVPVEIAPDDGDLSRPLDEWTFGVDVAGYARDLPDWWDAEREERRARAALVDWAKARLTGWRVHEAFHPVHPFRTSPESMAPERVRELVRQWSSVWGSVRDSVWDSVENSVWDSVRDSVQDSVWGYVRDSVWGSVGGSVWDSVGAYTGSLFPNITAWHGTTLERPWDGLRELWLSGRVPSNDGTTWRVHTGPDGRVEMCFNRGEVA